MKADADGLEHWIESQYRFAAQDMLRCVSACGVVKRRPWLRQTVKPKRGSIVACVELADYDPDPDYFFHWHRDAAVVLEAIRLLWLDQTLGSEALAILADFVDFNIALRNMDGRALVRDRGWRAAIAADYAKFVRIDAELAEVHGANVAAEARVNADGTIDAQRWARPQNDGPAARSLALMRWAEAASAHIDTPLAEKIGRLVREDLAFALERWRAPSFDIWEEESGAHYYTRRLLAAALSAGAAWLEGRGESEMATARRAASAEIFNSLDLFWSAEDGFMHSRLASGAHSKALDISVILAALHGGGDAPTHSVRDPRLLATLAKIEQVFARDLPINRDGRTPAPALGRYPGDAYFGGGAWYVSTLAAAEFYYRIGSRGRGDAFLSTVRLHTPSDGQMSEQFDRASGEQISAKRLAWSYAAFISCIGARRACLGRAQRGDRASFAPSA